MLRVVGPLAVALLVLFTAGSALAQTVALPQAFQRKLAYRLDDKNNTWMNYQDCVLNDVFTWETKITQFSGRLYEVWAGKGDEDCSLKENRTGATARCWNLFSVSPTNTDTVVQISVQDIAGQLDSGGAAACERTDMPSAGDVITLHFMLVSGDNADASAEWKTKLDLVGPPAPAGVSAGVGENRVIVEWTPGDNTDLLGYKLFCDPPPGSAASSPASGPMGSGLGGTAGAAGAAGSAGAAGAAGAGGSAGAAGAAGSTGTGGTTGTPNPDCPSSVIRSGVRPDPTYECAYKEGKLGESLEAKNLVNGTTYAVGVAAIDDAGNTGPLSTVVCGTPQEVDDFFELYRRAGGKGGGGFCSIGRAPFGTAGALFAGLGAVWLLRRRNRK